MLIISHHISNRYMGLKIAAPLFVATDESVRISNIISNYTVKDPFCLKQLGSFIPRPGSCSSEEQACHQHQNTVRTK